MPILEELAQWIDDDAIANTIIEELEEQGLQPTLENAKKVWLDALEGLPHLIASSIVGLTNRGQL